MHDNKADMHACAQIPPDLAELPHSQLKVKALAAQNIPRNAEMCKMRSHQTMALCTCCLQGHGCRWSLHGLPVANYPECSTALGARYRQQSNVEGQKAY